MDCLVVFDFDGPLFNSRAPRDRALRSTYTRFGPSFGQPQDDIFSSPLYPPTKTIRLAYAEMRLSAQQLAEIEAHYRSRLRDEEVAQDASPEVCTLVEALHKLGCALAVLSMRSEKALLDLLRKLRLNRYFGQVIGRDTSPFAKPDPRSLQRLIENAKVPPARAIFVGDTDIDYRMSQAAGVTYFHAGWSGEPFAFSDPQGATYLGCPSELLPVVQHGFAQVESSAMSNARLIEVVKNKSFSFFAGAGVSIKSGIGNWESAYRPVLEKYCPASLIRKRSLPEIVQLIASNEPDARGLFDEFKDVFRTDSRSPNSYHFAMMRSRCQTIWTTNYDDLFEKAQVYSGQPVTVIKNDHQLKDRFGNDRKLIKVNGDFSDGIYSPGSMAWGVVLSDEQFDLAEHDRAELWRYFEDEYRTSSIVFVGISFNDPTLRRILSIISRKIMRTRNPHFVLTVMPKDPADRYLLLKNKSLLKKRDIHTVVFDDFDGLNDFVVRTCLMSMRPVVAFSGITQRPPDRGREDAPFDSQFRLPDAVMSIGELERTCGEMGRRLAELGFRVTSGHGRGVGIPAVAEAYKQDRRLARFYMRSEGDSKVSRQAPAVYVSGSDLTLVRQRLMETSHLLIAAGGTSTEEENSGTIEEIKMALARGMPVLLLTQGGGNVGKFYERLPEHVNGIADSGLRDAVVAANRDLRAVPAHQMPEFLETRFGELVTELLRKVISSQHSRNFDTASAAAAKDW